MRYLLLFSLLVSNVHAGTLNYVCHINEERIWKSEKKVKRDDSYFYRIEINKKGAASIWQDDRDHSFIGKRAGKYIIGIDKEARPVNRSVIIHWVTGEYTSTYSYSGSEEDHRALYTEYGKCEKVTES